MTVFRANIGSHFLNGSDGTEYDTDTDGFVASSDGHLHFWFPKTTPFQHVSINDILLVNELRYYESEDFTLNGVIGTNYTSPNPIEDLSGSQISLSGLPYVPAPIEEGIVTATWLQSLKNSLPIDHTDDTFDIRLAQLLQNVEEEVSAPHGYTRHVLRRQVVSFIPNNVDGLTQITIPFSFAPIHDILDLRVQFLSGNAVYPRASYRSDVLDSTLVLSSKYAGVLQIELLAGYDIELVPTALVSAIHQIAAIRFMNPDPKDQVIPDFIHHALNKL